MILLNKILDFFDRKLIQIAIELTVVGFIIWLSISFTGHINKAIPPISCPPKIADVYPVLIPESGEVLLIDKKSYVVKEIISKDIANGIFNLGINQIVKDYNKSINK